MDASRGMSRQRAINLSRNKLIELKSQIVSNDDLKSVLQKTGLKFASNQSSPLGVLLTEQEFALLLDSLELLSNESLEKLLNQLEAESRFRGFRFEIISVEDES